MKTKYKVYLRNEQYILLVVLIQMEEFYMNAQRAQEIAASAEMEKVTYNGAADLYSTCG